MPNVESGPQPRVASDCDAIRTLLRAGKNDEAIVKLCPITVTQLDFDAKELLFDAFFFRRAGRGGPI